MFHERASFIWGLIVAAIGVFGVIGFVIKLTTAQTVDAMHIGFYFGVSVVAAYICGIVGFLVGGLLYELLAKLFGPKGSTGAGVVAGIVGLAAGIFVLYVLISADVLFNFDATDDIGHASMALIGLGGVCLAIYFWRRSAKKAKARSGNETA